MWNKTRILPGLVGWLLLAVVWWSWSSPLSHWVVVIDFSLFTF
jgi:hypothetical protein